MKNILFGGSFAFAAAAQPGPLQAFLMSRVAASGWKRTLPAALAPLISDVPIAIAAILLLGRFAHGFEFALRGIGGLVFLYFAVKTYIEWRTTVRGEPEAPSSSPRTLMQAVVVNLLNPGPYLGWSLILGPAFLEAWTETPANSIALVVSFYAVMIFCLGSFILIVGLTSIMGPSFKRGMLLASAIALAGIAVSSLWSSLWVFLCRN